MLDNALKIRFLRVAKGLIVNFARFSARNMMTMGMCPPFVTRIINTIESTFRGHVVVVPQPCFYDYKNILTNLDTEMYNRAF